MRNGRDKLDIPYLAIVSVVLLTTVVVSLYFFPQWRKTPAMTIVLLVAAVVSIVELASNFRTAFIRERDNAAPAALDYDSPQHRRNQENVCANVRAAWIDGVLRESLPERIRIELALDNLPGMLQRRMVAVEGQAPRRTPVDEDHLADLFRSSGRALLILGAPGSGKTVTLLELCRPLLEGAEADPRRPVPVVLNLSTWAQRQPTLEQWIAGEMWRQYGLNKKVTPAWLAADHLTLLLDGLDEVAAGARDACVRAINADGRGWLDVEHARYHLAGKGSLLRVCGWRRLRQHLAQGEGVFWHRDEQDRLWLNDAERIAHKLDCGRFRQRASGWHTGRQSGFLRHLPRRQPGQQAHQPRHARIALRHPRPHTAGVRPRGPRGAHAQHRHRRALHHRERPGTGLASRPAGQGGPGIRRLAPAQ